MIKTTPFIVAAVAAIIVNCSVAESTFAAPSSPTSSLSSFAPASPLSSFALRPRLSVAALSGSSTPLLGSGELIAPLYGDQNHLIFGIIEGGMARQRINHSDDLNNDNGNNSNYSSWNSGIGIGYRRLIHDRIYGGYLTASASNVYASSTFWVINPGLEFIAESWDLHLNAYLPLKRRVQNFATTKWADELHIYDYIEHTGHLQYNRHAEYSRFAASSYGADIKVGHAVPHFSQAKIYLAGYYFNAPTIGRINGAALKITYDLSKYVALELADSYDNFNHNKALLGVKLTLGGYSAEEKTRFGLASKLTNGIERGYEYGGAVVPIAATNSAIRIVDGARQLQYDNLWFINGAATAEKTALKDAAEDGTYEHPFHSFTPATYSFIHANANVGVVTKYPQLYFSAGEYNLAGFSSIDGKLSGKLYLAPGWGVYGRSADFARPAVGVERPVFIGGFDVGSLAVESTAKTSAISNNINAIIIHETGESERGAAIMRIYNAPNVVLTNVAIGADSLAHGGYFTGIWASNSLLRLSSVQVTGTNDDGADNDVGASVAKDAAGIIAQHTEIDFADGVNEVTALGVKGIAPNRLLGADANGTVYGVEMSVGSALNFRGGQSKIVAVAARNGTYFSDKLVAIGVSATDSAINFERGVNKISAATSSEGAVHEARGIDMVASRLSAVGGENIVAATNDGYPAQSEELDEAFAVNAVNSTLAFYGGVNDFSATNRAANIDLSEYVAYGIYALNSRIIFGNENAANGGGSADTGKTAQKTVISAANFAVGDENTEIKAHAYALYGDATTINFNSGATSIMASNSSEGAGASEYLALGLWIRNGGTLNFNGGVNRIIASNSIVTGAVLDLSACAISANSATINFSAGENSVIAVNKLTAQSVGDLTVDAFGLYADNAKITFGNSGNLRVSNTISASNEANLESVSEVVLRAYGMNVRATEVSFNSGNNVINAQNTNKSGAKINGEGSDGGGRDGTERRCGRVDDNSSYVYGILASEGTVLNFSGGSNTINVADFVVLDEWSAPVNHIAYGILADDESWLRIKGVLVGDLHELSPYVKIVRDPAGKYGDGGQISWGDKFWEW